MTIHLKVSSGALVGMTACCGRTCYLWPPLRRGMMLRCTLHRTLSGTKILSLSRKKQKKKERRNENIRKQNSHTLVLFVSGALTEQKRETVCVCVCGKTDSNSGPFRGREPCTFPFKPKRLVTMGLEPMTNGLLDQRSTD
jgi:hypothetical protein